jgi:hypothetical protein
MQGPVAGRGGGKLLGAELAADAVEGGGHVGVEVGVDPAGDDDARFCHGGGHAVPSSSKWMGWHVTCRTTDKTAKGL